MRIVFDESSICQDNKYNNVHDLSNKLDSNKFDSNNDDEIYLKRMAWVSPEVNLVRHEETTLNQAVEEIELVNDHQPEVLQEEIVSDANEDLTVWNQDPNDFGPCLWEKESSTRAGHC